MHVLRYAACQSSFHARNDLKMAFKWRVSIFIPVKVLVHCISWITSMQRGEASGWFCLRCCMIHYYTLCNNLPSLSVQSASVHRKAWMRDKWLLPKKRKNILISLCSSIWCSSIWCTYFDRKLPMLHYLTSKTEIKKHNTEASLFTDPTSEMREMMARPRRSISDW